MRFIVTFLVFSVASVASGCGRQAAAQAGRPAAPQVTAAQVISRPITEFEEFSARFEAVERVELRPRVRDTSIRSTYSGPRGQERRGVGCNRSTALSSGAQAGQANWRRHARNWNSPVRARPCH